MRGLNRKINHVEIDSEGSWAISYGDMVTLLMCFFILFFAIDKKREHETSLQAALLQIFSPKEHNAESTPSYPTINIGDKNEHGMSEEVLKDWHGVAHKVGNKILVEFPAVSFFKSGEIELTAEGKASLAKFVEKYVPFAGQHMIGIRAFTDTKKVMSSKRRPKQLYLDNLELSALRSVATIRTLQKLGIPLDRMRAGGYGELKVTVDDLAKLSITESNNETLMNLARRVVLVIEPGGKYDL
jgi:chemotaxis protein MotB